MEAGKEEKEPVTIHNDSCMGVEQVEDHVAMRIFTMDFRRRIRTLSAADLHAREEMLHEWRTMIMVGDMLM